MKKIVVALTLLLAFSINANAQEKTGYKGMNSTEIAKKQAAQLAECVGLDKTLQNSFENLFEQKFMILDDKKATPERKLEMSRIVEAKIRASLDANQTNKLEKNPDLLKALIN